MYKISRQKLCMRMVQAGLGSYKELSKVSGVSVNTLVFIAAMIVTFWVKGAVPDTLIQYTLGAGGVEALLLAGIKITKVRAGEGGENDEEVP